MQYKLPITLALSMLTIGVVSTRAQTISTFDDVTLPGTDTTYLESIAGPDGTYTYQSGNATFYGKKDFGGSYYANFNCANHTDTVTAGFGNMWSNIAGTGALNSANYGIAYVETDYSVATAPTIPVGVKLTGSAAGHQVAGGYFTNTVYAYRYMLDNNFYADEDHWFKLVIRGYLNNTQSTDSVVFTLADYSVATPVLVNTWQWVNLTSLGNIDSLTFDLVSSDAGAFGINTPAYFAIDNLTTLDGVCPLPQNIAAVSINENSATINWTNSIDGFTSDYQIAVDQSATLAPVSGTPSIISANTYNALGLSNNTVYYAHVRSSCGDGSFSDWDTATFKTLQGTGIFQTNANNLQLSISPNPATDFITLHAGIAVNAIIYGIEGKELMHVNQAKTINISSLPTGVYLLKVTDAAGTGKQTTLRFTKN